MTKLLVRVCPMKQDSMRLSLMSETDGKVHHHGKLHVPKWMYAQMIEALSTQFAVTTSNKGPTQ